MHSVKIKAVWRSVNVTSFLWQQTALTSAQEEYSVSCLLTLGISLIT